MRTLLAVSLCALLTVSQAEARGGGGGGGGHGGGGHGGGHAGSVGFFAAGNFGFSNVVRPGFPGSRHAGFSHRVVPFVRHQQLVVNRNVVPFRPFLPFHRFSDKVGGQWNGQQWAGGFWWPAWAPASGESYPAYAAPMAPPAPADPQVIVLASNGKPAISAGDDHPADYSVGGCHPIPNGYHCGQ